MDNAQATRQLKVLLKAGGALLIITAEHDCGANPRGPANAKEQKLCDAYKYPATHPRHFVIHEGTRLEEGLRNGQVRVRSEEGDYTQGQPDAVLARLLEAGAAKE